MAVVGVLKRERERERERISGEVKLGSKGGSVEKRINNCASAPSSENHQFFATKASMSCRHQWLYLCYSHYF